MKAAPSVRTAGASGARRAPRPVSLLAGLLALLVASAVLAPSLAKADQPPATPSSVTVTRADGTVTAEWPAADGATGYHITYSSNNKNSWTLAAYDHPDTSITIDDATNSATYHVAVRALNASGGSGWRNSDPAAPWGPPPPATPASVTVTRADGTLTASWPAPDGATGYHITYSTNNKGSWSLAAYNHPTNSITINATNSATYHIAVRALNASGGSGWRNSAAAAPWTPPPPPATPSVVSVTRADGTLDAAWPAPDGATGYHITYSTNNKGSWSLAAYNHPTNSITINATNSATYHVAVRALNAHGGSGWRNSGASGPYIPPEPVAAPASVAIGMNTTEVTIGRGGNRKIESLDVSWSAVTGAVSYQVHCAEAFKDRETSAISPGEWSLCADNVSGTSTTITSSDYEMWYRAGYMVRVRAKDSSDVWGGWTSSQAAWPVWRIPGRVMERGDGTLVLEWYLSPLAELFEYKYRAYCSSDNRAWTKCADNVPNTSVNADGYVVATVTDLDLATSGIQAVQNSSSYWIRGLAFNSTGTGHSTTIGPFDPLTAPAKFSNVTATRGDGTITVTVHRPAFSWLTSVQMSCAVDGGSSGACPGSPFSVDLDRAWADNESFTINVGSANNSKAYAITAQGVNALGTGTASDSVSAPAISSPAQIASVTAVRGVGTLTVSWTEPTGNYLSYDVQCSSDSGTTWTATCTRGTGSVDGTTYIETLTGVSDSTAYTVRVRAKNNMGTAAWRQSAAIPVEPARIASITVSRGNGNLALSWTVPASNGVTISGYDIQCSNDSGATWTATCTRGTGTTSNSTYSETLTGVSNSTAYTVRARAKNANATGPWRESAAIAALAAPGAPQNVSVGNAYLSGSTRLYPVNWNKPSSAASNESLAYEVQCSTQSNPTSTQWNNCGTVASTTSTNLSRNVGHNWLSGLFKKIRVRTKKYSDLYSAWVEADTQYT